MTTFNYMLFPKEQFHLTENYVSSPRVLTVESTVGIDGRDDCLRSTLNLSIALWSHDLWHARIQ